MRHRHRRPQCWLPCAPAAADLRDFLKLLCFCKQSDTPFVAMHGVWNWNTRWTHKKEKATHLFFGVRSTRSLMHYMQEHPRMHELHSCDKSNEQRPAVPIFNSTNTQPWIPSLSTAAAIPPSLVTTRGGFRGPYAQQHSLGVRCVWHLDRTNLFWLCWAFTTQSIWQLPGRHLSPFSLTRSHTARTCNPQLVSKLCTNKSL